MATEKQKIQGENMNNIITNCDNNCSDYQSQTFTVIIADKDGNAVNTYSCKFGQQFTIPNPTTISGRDFLYWQDGNIRYASGTTINIQSNITFVPKYTEESWKTVWTGASNGTVTDSAIVAGRRTRVTASTVSYYDIYSENDGCYSYWQGSTSDTASGTYELPKQVGNCHFALESGKIKVSYTDYSDSADQSDGEGVIANGGSATITKVEQFF